MKNKERWIPQVGDMVRAYSGDNTYDGKIILIRGDTFKLNTSYFVFHRNQLRRLTKKPKREKIVAWMNLYSEDNYDCNTVCKSKKEADYKASSDRIRCVRLEEVSDEN